MKLTTAQEAVLRSLANLRSQVLYHRYRPIVKLVEVGFARVARPGTFGSHDTYEATEAGRAWLAEKDKATP